MVETGLMIVVIFMVVFWIFEICMLMYTYTVIGDCANEGVRYGIVHSNVVAGDSRIVDHVKVFAAASLHNVSAITVNVTLPDGDSKPPHRVKVVVHYTYVPWLSGFITPPSMGAYAEGRMVVQ